MISFHDRSRVRVKIIITRQIAGIELINAKDLLYIIQNILSPKGGTATGFIDGDDDSCM